MTEDVKAFMKNAILPVFLGNSREARRLMSRLFGRFGIVSLFCDRQRSLSDLFSLGSRFFRLCESTEPDIIKEQLLAIASKYSDYVMILIPSGEEFSSAVSICSRELEARFIISSTDKLLCCPPIADLSA